LAGGFMLVVSPFAVGGSILSEKLGNYKEKRDEKKWEKYKDKEKKEYIKTEKLDITTDYNNDKEITEEEKMFLDDLKIAIEDVTRKKYKRKIIYSKFRKTPEIMIGTPTKTKINKNHPVVRKMIERHEENPTEIYSLGMLALFNDNYYEAYEIRDYANRLPIRSIEGHKSDFMLNPEKYYNRGTEEFKKHFDILNEKQKRVAISNLMTGIKDEKRRIEPNREIDKYIEESFGPYIYENILSGVFEGGILDENNMLNKEDFLKLSKE